MRHSTGFSHPCLERRHLASLFFYDYLLIYLSLSGLASLSQAKSVYAPFAVSVDAVLGVNTPEDVQDIILPS